jgi:uncharacterized membrane protein
MEDQFTPQTNSTPATDNGKTIAIVSYITLIGFIAAVIMHSSNKTSLGAFHLRQMLLLILFGFLAWIPFLGLVVALALLVFWVLGLISAINGEEKPLPLIGELAQKWFANAFN